MLNVSGNAMWHLVAQSDWMSKGVLLTLLVMSIVCWTIFFYKLSALRAKQQQLLKALSLFKDAETFDQMLTLAASFAHTAPGYLLSKNLALLKATLGDNKERVLTQQQWKLIEQTMQQHVDEMMTYEESGLNILSATIAVSPLLGLYGTIWGLVHAFIDISKKQSADIATVAPGIAEALITTLAGLIVAIPALIMFHYLTNKMAAFEQRLLSLSDRFAFVVQKLFVW